MTDTPLFEKVPIPANEEERLKALDSYNIMDTEAEEEFDALTSLVAELIDVPITLISLVDGKRQWFKSRVGLDAQQTPRDISFCQHAIMQDAVFEVNNALEHELFKDNPLVQGAPNIRFYAGAPLEDSNGYNLGTLCVIDNRPRELTAEQRKILKEYAKAVVELIESKKS